MKLVVSITLTKSCSFMNFNDFSLSLRSLEGNLLMKYLILHKFLKKM